MIKKRTKIIVFIMVAIAFIVFFVHGYHKDKKAKNTFIEIEFYGIIKEIKYTEGNRGFPILRINDKWINLGINAANIYNFIHESDSIVKDSGTERIKVYRKNPYGKWDEIVFY